MMYYHNSNKQTCGSVFRPTLLLCLCLFASFLSVPAMAQVVIGGDVYGGGKQGAVNSTSDNATSVTIKSGSVRTVFGGGQEGAVSGNTQVTVSGGEIGGVQWNGSIHGGVFGAGDGMAATVEGISRVSVSGGTIHNNVYGGGNQAKLIGSTEVVLQGGNMWGDVYAGARMADIEGRTFVNIDGANAQNSLIIRSVYGGNDISGDISGSADALPIVPQHTAINNTWNAIVYATPSNTYPVFVASLYGSGNGDYNYSGENNISLKKWDEGTGTLVDATYSTGGKPQLNKTYIELNGGIYGQVYGGGNFATVNQETVIYTNNSTNLDNAALNRIPASYKNHLALFDNSGYHIEDENMVFDYHVNRMFGGNNKEIMSIRPTWNLQQASINNLYSGGNRGAMTYPNGIFLALQSANINVNNVYGGCRMADVNPNENNGVGNITPESLYGYAFDAGYAARVYITDGKINNVYGGNDISGKVYYGTNVEMALLENKPRSASAIAHEDCRLMVVNRQNFDQMVGTQPQLISRLTTMLSERLWSMYRHLDNACLRDYQHKMIDMLALQLEKNRKYSGPYQSDISVMDLATMCVIPQHHLYTVTSEFQSNGRIKIVNGKIYVPDCLEVLKQSAFCRKQKSE